MQELIAYLGALVVMVASWAYEFKGTDAVKKYPEGTDADDAEAGETVAGVCIAEGANTTGARELLINFAALGIRLLIVVAGSLLRQYWLVAVLGFLMTTRFAKSQGESNLRGAMAFLGILIAAYGIIGTIVQILIFFSG
jgi:hypothetical protein